MARSETQSNTQARPSGNTTLARLTRIAHVRLRPAWLSAGLMAGAMAWAHLGSVSAQVPATQPAATAVAEAAAATADESPLVTAGIEDGKLKLLAGRSTIITTQRPYKRVAIADGEIASVKPLTAETLLVTPKKAVTTQLIVWDDNDRAQTIDLLVAPDTRALADQLKTIFPDAKIEVSAANENVVLRGRVGSAEAAQQALQVASAYSPKVLNFLEVSGGQQVSLQVRFAEVSRSATSALGVNLFAADGSFVGGSNIGGVNPTNILPSLGGVGNTPAPIGITASPKQITGGVTLFGAGQIGSFYLEGFVQAMRQNNLLRILAEPNLLTMNGKEAEFLAGGSFPIPVAGGASTGGTSNVTIEFKEFGVKLRMTPVVLGDGRIRMRVTPEVSDLDFTTAVRFDGFTVPGLSQRRVDTTIELAEGQTFAIAGLLNNTVSATKDVTPVLGDVPVLGALFRSVRYQRKETELIVLVTPRLVEPMNPGQVPQLPGEKWRHPNENELFLKQDLGGPIAPAAKARASSEPPKFYGSYGFNAARGTGKDAAAAAPTE